MCPLLIEQVTFSEFQQQKASVIDVRDSVVSFCKKQSTDKTFGLALEKTQGERSLGACVRMFYTFFYSKDIDKDIQGYVDNADKIDAFPIKYSRQYIKDSLTQKYQLFKSTNRARDLTNELKYVPETYSVKNMITAAFAHGSWSHVLGNLFFFFAFAAAIEVALGFLAFSALFIALAIGTHLTYSLTLIGVADPLPTLGLSGVVAGMIGLCAYLMPTVKIRCFLWFIIIFRVLRIPAWILATWYIGWDIYNLNHSDHHSNINFVAHVSGAVIGFLLGLLLFRKRRVEIQAELKAHA